MNFNRKLTKRILTTVIPVVVIAILVLAPFYMNTHSFPTAIVEGNSMYPNLQNGDLVLFHGVSNPNTIPNGTIIVFVQGSTGVSLLDTLTKPVVIHRVIGRVIQADGTVYYQTKGDNNALPDPQLTQADHVLGTPVGVIPKAGILFLFIQSPQGLVATIGFIVLVYLSNYDAKISEIRKKSKLLTMLSKKVFEGKMSVDEFRKLEVVLNYQEMVNQKDADARLVDLRPVMKKIRAMGWNVKVMPIIVGVSGSTHVFDFAIYSKLRPESPVTVIDFDTKVDGDGTSEIISMYVKAFDTSAASSIVLSTRPYTDEAKNLAGSYGIVTIDDAKPGQVGDLLLGAISAMLEKNKELNEPATIHERADRDYTHVD